MLYRERNTESGRKGKTAKFIEHLSILALR